jgi:hypothetical protein
MRRPLASAVAAALLILPATAAAEPLDLDLYRLGAPNASAWEAMGESPADAARLAGDAKKRFAILSSEMALAFSAAVLQPASTTGHAGFDFELEGAYVAVHPEVIGSAGATSGFAARDMWPTRSMTPHELFVPSFHVRKALPFSFELGGRMLYLSQSSLFAAQLEGKWALNEGFDVLPDVAVRAAWTQVFGQRDWNLGTGDLDLIVSKRWGVNAVTSFTPYLAARFTFVNASTDVMDFAPAAGDPAATQAAFPTLRTAAYRTTLGLRMTAYVVSMAAEATYFAGKSYSGGSGEDEYPDFGLDAAWGGAFKFGFEF